MGANLGINLVNKGLNVYGEDINPDVEKRAEKFGINIKSNAEKYDLTILSMPINNIISFLSKEHEIDKSELIIDIGGTKESICDLMDNSNIPAIGGHPMCGLADNTNWEPHPEMYKNATFLLCETNSTNDKAKEITRISPHSSNRIRKIVINRIRKSDFIGIHLYQLAPKLFLDLID